MAENHLTRVLQHEKLQEDANRRKRKRPSVANARVADPGTYPVSYFVIITNDQLSFELTLQIRLDLMDIRFRSIVFITHESGIW